MANFVEDTIRILQVDDDSSILHISKQMLELMDNKFAIDLANSVDEAFQKLTNGNKYDIIISDYEMPLKNGLDFLKELKEKKHKTPFVLFTGKGREEVAIKALNLGADGYYNKQGDPETVYGELSHGLTMIVKRRRAELQLIESEKKENAILSNAPMGIATSDSNSYFLTANKVFCQILGYSEEELHKLTFKDLTYSEDIAKSVYNMDKLVSGKVDSFTQEKRYIRKDGAIVDGKVTVSAIRDESGKQNLFVALLEDITQQKREEQRTKIFSQLFELVSDAIFVHDLTGKFLYFNQSAYQTRGYTPDELSKMSVRELDSPNCPDTLDEGIKTLLEKGEMIIERIHRCKDGSDITVELHARIITIGDQKLVLTVARDITERKLAENRLRDSQAQMSIYLENCGIPAFIANQDGNYTYVNQSAIDLIGYTKEEFLNMKIPQLLFREDLKEKMSNFTILKQTGAFREKIKLRCKNGNPVVVDLNAVKLPNQMLIAFCDDITERERIQAQSEKEALLIKSIIESSNDAIFSVDTQYNYTCFNKAHAQVMKTLYNADIAVGKNILDCHTNSNDRQQAKENIDKALSGKETIVYAEAGDSSLNRRFFEILHTPILNQNNEITGVVVFAKDITAKKKAELQFLEDQTNLKNLNEKLQVLGRLTRHDVANKHSIIISNTYLLKKKTKNSDLLKLINNIETAVNEADMLFEFSRLYEKIGAEKLSYVDVTKSFNDAVELNAKTKKLSIVSDCQGLKIVADSLLTQLFYNLLDNSLKHGQTVKEIRISCKQNKKDTSLVYEDDGVGIKAENKTKIFTQGFTTGRGSGLGLSLVKKMVEVYGWTITENGKEGKGARFEITIPNTSVSFENNPKSQ